MLWAYLLSISKTCSKHGELSPVDIRVFDYKGYQCKQCRLCNKEIDKKRIRTEVYRQRKLEKSREPEERAKQKIRAIAYRARRRVVSKALHERKREDPEYQRKLKHYRDTSYQRSKELFNDSYIKKVLKIYKNATPEQIEYKKKEILAYREARKELLEKRKTLADLKEKRKIYLKENNIVKVCLYHGELTIEQANYSSNGKKYLSKVYRCKQCVNKKSAKGYIKHYGRHTAKQLEYRVNNRESINARSRKWYQSLQDRYVSRLLSANTGLVFEDIDPKLIELKRNLILIKRKIKEIKNGKTKTNN